VRIFNGDLTRGGRFYAVGSSWQNVPGEVRTTALIDGQETVELDYSALHPSLLYSEVGAPVPADCYAVDGWPRTLGKLALLILLNAGNAQEARGALARSLAKAENFLIYGGDPMDAAGRLIREVKKLHRPIAQAFHSDAGARLMRQDSKIAGRVLSILLKQGVVGLPVHDSFVVRSRDEDALEAAMYEAAEQNGLKRPIIKKKERSIPGPQREPYTPPPPPYVGTF